MHRIGEFASLTGLSVKTLRFYDEIGLLMPASVGSHTGYRLYSADQVERARYSLSLRQFGLTLAEIKAILATGASERDTLEVARQRLNSSLSEGQRLLCSIEARLAQLPSGDVIRLCRLKPSTCCRSWRSVCSLRSSARGAFFGITARMRVFSRLNPLSRPRKARSGAAGYE